MVQPHLNSLMPEAGSPEGANGNLGTYHAAGLPNITGSFNTYFETEALGFVSSGAFYKASTVLGWGNNARDHLTGVVGFTAKNSNALYGKAATVQPTSFCTQYLIKY